MKKVLPILLSMFMVLTLMTACGNTGTSNESAKQTSSASNVLRPSNSVKPSESSEKEDAKQPVLLDSGYTVLPPNSIGSVYLTYVVKIQNQNKDMAAEYTTITITGKNEDGSILFTEDQSIGTILPGDTVYWADDSVNCKNQAPDTVEITVDGARFVPADEVDDTALSSDFIIENLSEVTGSYDKSLTGEITNNSEIDFDDVAVTVVYKQGDEIVGGFHSYVENMPAGKRAAFDISSWNLEELEYDSIEVYALSW